MSDAVFGMLLTLAAVLLYGGGVATGWLLRGKLRPQKLSNEQSQMLEALRRYQDAETALLNYSVEDAYGFNGRSGLDTVQESGNG